jgi:hypothetical protein
MGYDAKDPIGSVGSLGGRQSGPNEVGGGTIGNRSNPALSQSGSATAGVGLTDSAPLMGGNQPASAQLADDGNVAQSVEGNEPYVYRAKALYACEWSPSSSVSFSENPYRGFYRPSVTG